MAKNILHINDTTGPGGAETVFLNLIKKLDVDRFKPHVVLKEEKGWLYDEIIKSGITPTIIKSEWSSFDLKHLLRLFFFIRKNKIDIIHSHLFGANVYSSILGVLCGVPVISTFHGMEGININDKYLSLKFMLINKGSRKIVFVSDYLRSHYIKSTLVNRNKSLVIHNGINTSAFKNKNESDLRTELGYTKEHILIGSIGNIRKPKGYDIMLKAAAILKQRCPQCRFIVVGEGDNKLSEDLMELRESLEVTDTVNFLGFRQDIGNILKGLDIFLLPSTSEGFSLSTIEAMASGVPVIVTDSGGPGEIVTHEKDGIMVSPNDAEAIADAIQKNLSGKNTISEMTKQAKITVKNRFSIDKMIDTYSSLYEQELTRKVI